MANLFPLFKPSQSLASMTGDLSSMTAPPFILSPTSLTEFPAYWGERPELFADIARGKDEAERAERVLRWFICTLKGQYTVSFSGCGATGGERGALMTRFWDAG